MKSSGIPFIFLFQSRCNDSSRQRLQPHRALPGWAAAIVATLLLPSAQSARAQVDIYARGFDDARTGANLNETTLTPSNVNSSQFGKLFAVNLDGEVYAQPLYLSHVSIAGGTHNVVYVATMNNTVYALDADTGARLWTQNFGPGINTGELPGQNVALFSPTGILSTPVIDPVTKVMYLVHGNETQAGGSPSYRYFLEALDSATGTPLPGTPVNIAASYLDADLASPVVFNPKTHHQRSSLALANGNVYFAFCSWDDVGKWHGWVLSYDKSTLMQNAVYNTTPLGSQGGIWMAGSAPAVDAEGNLYYSTGNGSSGVTPNNLVQTGESIIKLSPSLQLLDYFTPKNQAALNAGDMDLASGGVMLVPSLNSPGQSSYALAGGKQGVLYLLDLNDLGKFDASQDNAVQEFQAVFGYGTSHIHGTPIYFKSAASGPTAYVWGENDFLRGFRFSAPGGLLDATPFAMSAMTAPTTHVSGAMPGGFLSLSANGGGDGIVWASTPYTANAVKTVVQGALYAFDAETLQLLWSDKFNDSRDEVGLFAKFCPPIVANGKMYMPNFGPTSTGTTVAAGQLLAYGLLPKLTVQVANTTMAAGAPSLPGFHSTVSGLVHGDAVGTTLDIGYSTTANSSSPAGTYPITATVTGSSASNYYVVVDAGTLTVTGNPTLTVQVNDAIMDAGSATLPAFTATVSGLADGDSIGTTLAIAYSTPANSSSSPGAYPVTATITGSSASRYNIVIAQGTLTVVSAPYYPNGFTESGLILNNGATLVGSRLRLTDGHIDERRSAFFSHPVNIQQFSGDFQFQLSNAVADGITFVIQGSGPNAIGQFGGGLGYQLIPKSVAVKFDLYSNAGEGADSTGVFINGAYPALPSVDLSSTGIDLHSGHIFNVLFAYAGTTLTTVITDTATSASATQTYTVNIPAIVGGPTAYVGFTGGSGGTTSTQEILSWTYRPSVVTVPQYSGFAAYRVTLNGGAALSGTDILLTDGAAQEGRSAFMTTPLNTKQFTASFDFQIANPNGDGMTFTIQGAGPNVFGSPGEGLGYAGIPRSIAVKFDLHGNSGEGNNSTGLYKNGALPTVPSIALSNGGTNLHSGNVFNVFLAYDGKILSVSITDTVAGTFSSQAYNVDIPAIVGGSTAYFGFTGGTGGATSTQTVLDWSYTAGND